MSSSLRPEKEEEPADPEEGEEEEEPELSAEEGLTPSTLAALQAHLAAAALAKDSIADEHMTEAFGLAQFFYDSETSRELMLEALAHVRGVEGGRVAVLSGPSLLAAAQEIEGGAHMDKIRLLEYDERFGVKYADQFVRYDYREPEELPQELLGTCDVVFLDPPRLNVATLKEYFISARLLAREGASASPGAKDPPCIVVTAALLEDAVREEFGLRPVRDFEVRHTSKLGNPLQAYTNYKPLHLNRVAWDEEDN